MENKKDDKKENRFTYSDNKGLKVLSEKDIIDSITKESDKKEIKKSEEQDTLIKKDYTQWL